LSDDLGATTPGTTTTSLALVCGAVWLVASASAGALGIWSALGGASVALGIAVFVLDRSGALRLFRPSAHLVLVGAAAGWSMSAATYLLYPAFVRVLPFIRTDMASLYVSFREQPRVIAALALLPVILGEELVWRGVVQTALARRLGPCGGVPVAALTYAFVHAPLGSPVLVVVALSCGMAWGALRAASASLVPSLVAHLVWDILVLLWLPLDVR
jgi:membrane protease YdiL (CAAX protease family)